MLSKIFSLLWVGLSTFSFNFEVLVVLQKRQWPKLLCICEESKVNEFELTRLRHLVSLFMQLINWAQTTTISLLTTDRKEFQNLTFSLGLQIGLHYHALILQIHLWDILKEKIRNTFKHICFFHFLFVAINLYPQKTPRSLSSFSQIIRNWQLSSVDKTIRLLNLKFLGLEFILCTDIVQNC